MTQGRLPDEVRGQDNLIPTPICQPLGGEQHAPGSPAAPHPVGPGQQGNAGGR